MVLMLVIYSLLLLEPRHKHPKLIWKLKKHNQFSSSRMEVKIISVWKISGRFQKLRGQLEPTGD